MEAERINKGDLVLIKKTNEVGIVVDIIRRSDQNPDWDLVCVHWKGSLDDFSPRKLVKNSQYFSRNSVKELKKLDKLYMYLDKGVNYVKK